jgi:hypothetical protein
MNRKIAAVIALVLVLGMTLVHAQNGRLAVLSNTPLKFQPCCVDFIAITSIQPLKEVEGARLNIETGGTSKYTTGLDASGNPC